MIGPQLAHVRFRGTIREKSIEPYLKLLSHVREKQRFKGLLLDVSSGGGDAVASTDLFRAVKRVAQKKPVVSTVGSVAASGGYVVALGAQKVFAHEDSVVGSIGVLAPHVSVLGLLDKLGIQIELLHHGKHKDSHQGLRPLTDEERMKMMETARGVYDSFIDLVARERKQSREKVLELATGEIWNGRQALSLGLVDALGDREDALEELSRLTGIPSRRLVEISPRKPFLERILEGSALSVSAAISAEIRSAIADGIEDVWFSHGRFR